MLRLQAVANCGWALVSSNHAPRHLIMALAERAYAVRDTFAPQELSMWFMSVIPYTAPGSPALAHIIAMEPTAVRALHDLDMRDANARRSVGWLLYAARLTSDDHSALFEALMARVPELMRYGVDATSVPQILQSLAASQYYHPQLAPYLVRALVADLRADTGLHIEASSWVRRSLC